MNALVGYFSKFGNNARPIIFEQGGHFPFIEESALFRDRLDVFLNSQ